MPDDDASLTSPQMGIGRSGVPSKKCSGRTVIRHQHDGEGFRKGDPVLDEDGARTYRPCEAWAANATDYCGNHGGSAPQTINAAKRTLALGADDFATALRAIAVDERVAPEVRLKAINSALDRIGVRTGVDVSMEAPGWQQVLGKMFGGSTPEDTGTPVSSFGEPSTQDERARDDDAADPTGIIRARVRKLTTPPVSGEQVDPGDPPAEPVATPAKRAPRARKAAPPPDNVVPIKRAAKKAAPPKTPKVDW